MFIEVDDARYHVTVQGEGPPVVLLHGFTGTVQSWKELTRELKEEFTCIAIDLPGHGKTVTPDRTMEQCCTDIAFIIQKLHYKRVHMVGYSMGGRVALSFAHMYPKFVASLTLESASPGLRTARERHERKMNDERLAQKIENEGLESFVFYWENIPLFASQKRLPNDVQENVRAERMSQKEAGLAMSLRQMGTGSQPSWWEDLVTYHGAVLLITGVLDEKFVRLNQEMANDLKHATLEVIEGAGHTVHIEQPTIFARTVKTFLQKQLV